VLLPFFFHGNYKKKDLADNHEHIIMTGPNGNEMLCGCEDGNRCVLVSVRVLEN